MRLCCWTAATCEAEGKCLHCWQCLSTVLDALQMLHTLKYRVKNEQFQQLYHIQRPHARSSHTGSSDKMCIELQSLLHANTQVGPNIIH